MTFFFQLGREWRKQCSKEHKRLNLWSSIKTMKILTRTVLLEYTHRQTIKTQSQKHNQYYKTKKQKKENPSLSNSTQTQAQLKSFSLSLSLSHTHTHTLTHIHTYRAHRLFFLTQCSTHQDETLEYPYLIHTYNRKKQRVSQSSIIKPWLYLLQNGRMNDWCFRPRFCTVKALLDRRQPGRMR